MDMNTAGFTHTEDSRQSLWKYEMEATFLFYATGIVFLEVSPCRN